MSPDEAPSLDHWIEALLRDDAAAPAELRTALETLYRRYRTQTQMLDRLVHISDRYQSAERDRGRSYAEQLQRKIRQVEKIVRISDGYQAMLQDLNTRLTRISTHDDLTELPNRRHVQERLRQAVAQTERDGTPFAVALIDIDHFKTINDSAGHAVGDIVLTRVAKTLLGTLRDYDVCARWGGEEFLMLLVSCDLDRATQLAERVRRAVADVDTSDLHPGLSLSVSIGVTAFRPGESIDDTLKRADSAMYDAKDAGRNRAVTA